MSNHLRDGDTCDCHRCYIENNLLMDNGVSIGNPVFYTSPLDNTLMKFHRICWDIWMREILQPSMDVKRLGKEV